MTTNGFRREAKSEVAGLLVYWREIERWIKIAEQVNKKAVIPAINELRYASRQLYYAITLLTKHKLSAGEMSSIRKRIIIADQYLMNADHDVIDSIIGFYSKIVETIDKEVGSSTVSIHFDEYPNFKKRLRAAEKAISGSRHDAVERKKTYRQIRDTDLTVMIEQYQALLDAEVQARFAREQLIGEIAKGKSREKKMSVFNIVCGLATLFSTGLAIYLWPAAAGPEPEIEAPRIEAPAD
jgi:hypothetical protein